MEYRVWSKGALGWSLEITEQTLGAARAQARRLERLGIKWAITEYSPEVAILSRDLSRAVASAQVKAVA